MTREEIAKVVKEIREHCKTNDSCRECEAYDVHGCCVFMNGCPTEWVVPKEPHKESEENGGY